MSHAPKNSWLPTASIDNLKQRAQLIARIRQFFSERDVLEVETPVMGAYGVTDPHIQSITTTHGMHLQTSPEYHMKRLLAADSGAIFQICKSFRKEESGRMHHPEFTMLEWYRPGFDHHDLMKEVDALLQCVLKTTEADKISYAECFEKYLNINPLSCSTDDLKNCAAQNNIDAPNLTDKDDWLNLLLSHLIEPQLGRDKPVFIYDYPASQSALAKINGQVAERFEIYFKGIELANGFHELTDADEQRQRFLDNNALRRKNNFPEIALDDKLLAALAAGLPDCAGVALGVDRLIMLALDVRDIHEVFGFLD